MREDELTSDALTADFRVLQRRRGHRFSLDDLATAAVAVTTCPAPRAALDLGCGIGSVLLMVGWRCREAVLFGIEAQETSAALARRNVAMNGLAERATIEQGDLRDLTRAWRHPRCDLVTGTPPYLPEGTALMSPDPQRAAARIELRGGVEDYLAAAARVLAEDGRVVVCADGRFPARVIEGARAAGLVPVRRLDVLARAGALSQRAPLSGALSRGPLLAVWTLRRDGEGDEALAHEVIAMRDERGERTEASIAMRRLFGLEGRAQDSDR